MSGAHKVARNGVVALLVAVWLGSTLGAVKPRDPNLTAPASRKVAAAQAPKTVASVRSVRAPLENPATFTPDMPFGRAIEILRHSTYPGVNIVVLWRDLEGKAGIDRNTPIGLDGVPGLRIRQYLELLLRSVSAGSSAELGFCLDGGVVLVATKDSLPKPKMETRIYDISDLAAPPSMAMPMMPMMPMMSPFGGAGLAQPYGNYGTGMPFNGYSPGMGYGPGGGYNSGIGYNPLGYPQGSANNTQRSSPNRSVLAGS